MKPTACTGCRLRRRKCNRESPICSSCKELNIPQELCIYRELNSNTKTCSSKVKLKEVQDERRKLLRQKFELKRVAEIQRDVQARSYRYRFNLIKSSAHSELHGDDYQSVSKTTRSFINNLDGASLVPKSLDSKSKIGSISWGSLMSAEPNMKVVLSKMDQIIQNQRDQSTQIRTKYEIPASDQTLLLSKVRSKVLSLSLELEPPGDYSLIENLFRNIEKNLPKEQVFRAAIQHQFNVCPYEFVPWVSQDEDAYFQKLKKVIKFKEDGQPKITINLPGDASLVLDLAFVISYLIFPSYHRSQLNMTEKNLNPYLFVDYSKILMDIHSQLVTHNSRDQSSLFPDLSFELLQAKQYSSFFDRYTPQGRHNAKDPLDKFNNLRQLISIARMLNLNQDIDIFYADKSSGYRSSMKTMWYFLVFVDIMESLETGLPPKIEPSEILRYEDHTNFATESIITMNRVLYKYNSMDLDAIEDPDEFIFIIENEFIGDLKTLLESEYGSIIDDLNKLKSYDFDDTSFAPSFMLSASVLPMRFNIYSLMQSLYFLCFKKIESFDKFSKRSQKFSILSMKYSSLIIYLSGEFFALYDGLLSHPNCYDYGVLESVIACFPHLSLAVRRVYICAGGRFFEGLPINKTSAINNLLHGKGTNESQLLKEIQLKKEYQVLFSIEDLEDHRVDNNEEELFGKYSMLLNHKYMIFSFSQVMRGISNGLFKENSNMKIAKFNHIVFYLLKLMSFFLNSSFTSDGSPIEEENLFMGLARSSTPSKVGQSTQENEFDFGELFERSINTSSNHFDFESFFNISPGLYQSSDIDQFLMSESGTLTNGFNGEEDYIDPLNPF